ncbi:MAG: hypothetical protein HYV63_29015 [Candidatus Schekmanbacteria bacterium]|nr:hypothetical protein [Candidatus Schekmanbacteria bacterium]
MTDRSTVTIYGIRHHGPGSARSLTRALRAFEPDCILIEGPADAAEPLSLLRHPEMEPPVALLGYVPDDPRRAVYYPFAVFSPEWQALQYGLSRGIKTAFMDLPVSAQLALAEADGAADVSLDTPAQVAEGLPETATPGPHPRDDPLRWLAEAAGYGDGERWWEHLVEQRRNAEGLFAGVLEAMSELRRELPPAADDFQAGRELGREAHMRTVIRAARKEGFDRIAVVCGAWHAPALVADDMPPAKSDAALLKSLPKVKAQVTWVPWTYGRLSRNSGYGAGIASPGWYHHLWSYPENVTERWLTRVARLLRAEDLDASSAQIIEAVRLAEALAALRDRPLPGLEELDEAAQAVFCFGNTLALRLIEQKLTIGDRLGRVPPDTPLVPLQRDVQREQKRLRLSPKASREILELDLRREIDLGRSLLMHRLALLDIPWGSPEQARGTGTFKEIWSLQWLPELAVKIIEAATWGNTVLEAAGAFARHLADDVPNLPALTALIGRVFLAELPDAAEHVMQRLQNEAALASDVALLIDALPPLANALRYGNVRETDARLVSSVVDGLVARICVGLPIACGSLNDDAAGEMLGRLAAMHEAVTLLQRSEHQSVWTAVLRRLADLPNLNGLIAGRAVRLLLETRSLGPEEAAQRMSLALSAAADPLVAAGWLEGFLGGSGLVLLHDEPLWGVVDEWVTGLSGELFTRVLPLLRRTFGAFAPPERRQMGARVKGGGQVGSPSAPGLATPGGAFDRARAEAVLPLIRQLLGI